MSDRSKSETTLKSHAPETTLKGRATSVGDFQHRDWSTIPVERVSDGIERQMIWGERLMVCRLRLAPHVVTPVHSHPHEQITIVERGRVRFVVGGTERVSSEGDVLHFPSRVEHGATMLDEEVVLIDIFSPVREDFLPGSSL
ncbi:MAG: cupin domain-containing protein [Vicinamibacterales bacterium]